MKPKTLERLALGLLIAYCLDLAWKVAHWRGLSRGVDLNWRLLTLALTVRFAYMGFLLFVFIRARRLRKAGKGL